MNREWVVDLVEHLPQGLISRGWGWMARRSRPRVLVSLAKHAFVAATGADMSEAAEPLGHYPTLEQLFLRRLRPGARRIDPEPAALICPVDGTCGQTGAVQQGELLQVKGKHYPLARLLDDEEEARRFEGGPYATLYLSPRDYHRVHAPLAGKVKEAKIIPGALMPVFDESVWKVDELFTRNERVIVYLESPDAGRVAVVLVGATLVGRISVAFDSTLRTNQPGQLRRRLRYDPPQLLAKGGELGAFELGSTVVLVAEPGRIELEGLAPHKPLRMGERIGRITRRSPSRTRRPASSGRRRKTERKKKS